LQTTLNNTPTLTPPPIKSQSPRGRRNWWATALNSVIAFVVVILAVEMIFAWVGIGETEYLQPNPVTGFEGIPGKSVTWRTEGFGRFRYNSIGAQDVEHSIAKPANTTRIAFLGDSFVEALQVDRSLNMCSQIEKRLNDDAMRTKQSRHFEMFNFGVSSANLSQCYLRLKNRVLQYHPDIVMVGLRVDAAIHLAPEAGAGFLYAARPTFSLDDHGNLIESHATQQAWMQSREGKRMQATQWLRANSHIWGVLGMGLHELSGWWKQVRHGSAHWGAEVEQKTTAFTPADGAAAKAPAAAPAPTSVNPGAYAEMFARKKLADDATTRKMWPTADALIAAMQQECAEHGAKLVLVRFCAAGHATNDVETALVKQTSEQRHIPMFDCGPTFDKAFAENQPIFFQGHFTPLGHRTFADAFYKFMHEQGLDRS
jgi:hypothetical protein